jgi:hypothetical protein
MQRLAPRRESSSNCRMRYTSNTLAECERPMIRLTCDKCGRKGQLRKMTLVSKYGPDIVMPDLLSQNCGLPAS